MARPVPLAGAIALVAGAGCSPAVDSGREPREPREADACDATSVPDLGPLDADPLLAFDGAPPRNLLLIVVDTLRRDALPFYGGRMTTPCFAGRADHVVRFDNLYAAGAWTGITTASLETGLWPDHHGFLRVDTSGVEPVAEDAIVVDTFASQLQAVGWQTGLLSGNGWVSPETGLDRGFDSANEWAGEYGRTESSVLGPAAREWLASTEVERPFFLHLQLLDNHFPYQPPDEYRDAFVDAASLPFPVTYDGETEAIAGYGELPEDEREVVREGLHALYDAETLAEDEQIEATLRDLDAAGRLDDTLVVITADHGETLGDAGYAQFGHGWALRQELVHLPLLVYHPRLRPGSVTERIRQIDVLPTIFAAIGIPLDRGDGTIVRAGDDRMAFGELFPNDDGPLRLTQVYAVGHDTKLVRDCETGEDHAWDLPNDLTESLSRLPEDLPGGPALRDDLDAQLAELAASGSPFSCRPGD